MLNNETAVIQMETYFFSIENRAGTEGDLGLSWETCSEKGYWVPKQERVENF